MFPEDLIKKRILITGANGMLGQRTIFNLALAKNYELLGVSLEDEAVFSNVDYKCVDLTNRDDFKQVVYNFCPDFIINTAAFTNVDLSETERETAWKVNVKGVEYVAEAARVIDAHVIHISTDYVFDGKRGPYSEKSRTNPLGYYGRTKLASENVLNTSGVFNTIIRTNVLFGIADSRPDFVRWVVSSLRAGKEIRIVTDQINNPTFIDDLVQAISKIIEFKKYGLYNIGGREFLSRYDFTIKIADYFQLDKSLIKKIVTEDLNQPAKRPLKSGLLTIKAESEFGFKPHSIEESLAIMKKELSL
ncbi:MAG: dTDP-4-dehydrorhamnose reductase [Ignavibacteria bacterium CG2_30_36_16]|nr:dTDP-4-dehydrorhamnose reductase [Ignavibacteria bacterium]OIP64221.1 MAG: dTDP-4-dehydrorhamnose reductase [Ignavibacteria bacterium CG2_30_36_16]PJB00731.1 MAG: dTDP-4-dehydrorhamnose reductase [Ignavibacteria bacterium CG_4_9_14_3_um_filter_36_18]